MSMLLGVSHLSLALSCAKGREIVQSVARAQFAPGLPSLYFEFGEHMVKTPNYKQEKKRREEAQKKRNEQEQQRKAARKGGPVTP
jgi:hypothetical protein